MSRRAAGCPFYSSIVVYTEKLARGFHMTGNQCLMATTPFIAIYLDLMWVSVRLAITVPALVPGDHVSTAHNHLLIQTTPTPFSTHQRLEGAWTFPFLCNSTKQITPQTPILASCWFFNPIQMRYVLASYCFRCICRYYNLDLVDMLPCGRPKFPSRQGTCPLGGN